VLWLYVLGVHWSCGWSCGCMHHWPQAVVQANAGPGCWISRCQLVIVLVGSSSSATVGPSAIKLCVLGLCELTPM
jgi:hypothetical protein